MIQGSYLIPAKHLREKLAHYGYGFKTDEAFKQHLIDYAIGMIYLECNQAPTIDLNVYSRFWTPDTLKRADQ